MRKHIRMLAVVGAASLLATLAGAPANAATAGDDGNGPGTGGGSTTFSAKKLHRAQGKAAAAPCKEMTVDGGFETPTYMQFGFSTMVSPSTRLP